MCFQATKEARGLAEDFKKTLHETHPFEADVLVPNCVYRGGCPELAPCGFWERFVERCVENDVDINNIQDRYDAYNQYFYGEEKE